MKTDDEQEMYELSPLGLQYRAELPRILLLSDSDLEGALAALDHYMDRAPPPAFQKALLNWKGRFYLEHAKYDDAIRELRAADAIQIPDDLKNSITKSELALALEKKGDAVEAYAVLTKALNEIEIPSLLLDLLPALVRVGSSLGQALPAGAQVALRRAKEFYGIDDQHALPDLCDEIARVEALKHEASVRYDALHRAVRQAESIDEQVALIEAYINKITVPYFKQLAQNLLQRVRDETAAKKLASQA